ncbi:hypothetical protein [Methanosarcina horonobensis]|uniref:hypothetical protein n=1 Tax=Methanosarcina horonobensis TaxID=418008 RepID=UPI0022B8E281|nr:hypothetical protein [Methanosarcina horonobensis]
MVDFEERRMSFIRAFFRNLARGMPIIVLVVVDVAANGAGIINKHLDGTSSYPSRLMYLFFLWI